MPLSASAIGVICKRCRKPIKLDHTDRVAEEFSVACPHCGHRTFYHDREIKPLGEK
jgi:DNA-directed RNA polymerase subunit RPC12/RpoP